MSGYTDSEKIQYALKTALYRTMQTAMSDSASVERSAPLRVFPTNIMKVNIAEAGKGDIDEDGKYITGHTNAGTTANLLDPEGTVKNYKIICPVNNVITSITISSLVGYGSSTKTEVDALPTSGQTYPLKQWFFRGHYSGTGEAAFDAASAAYTGLQLAWNSSTNGATPGESDIVPHLKFYLQVQTNYTGVSHSSSTDNITYEHDLLKGLIGLDSNFVSTIMVTQGQGGPASCASLGTSGSQAGEYWFTQPSSGILSFYGVTNKVDASTDLATANFATKFPMISYVRYTGETGFGAGTGGGGGGSVTLASADSNVSNMIGGTAQTMTTTTFEFDGNVSMNGNVGIGITDPGTKLTIVSAQGTNNTLELQNLLPQATGKVIFQTPYVGNDVGLAILTGGSSPTERMRIRPDGNVGIGTTSPDANLDVFSSGKVITNTAYKTKSWAQMKTEIESQGGYIQTRDQLLSLESSLLQSGQDKWAAGVTRLGGGEAYKQWYQIGNSNHVYGREHPNYPSWGDGTVSHSFRDTIAIVSKPLKINHGFFINHYEHSAAWGQAVFQMVAASTNYCTMGFAKGTDSGSNDNVLEALTFNRKGNVGIGTPSPGSTLEIKDLTSGTAGEVESILKVNSVSGYHMVSLGTAGPTNYHSGSISIYKTLGATGTTKSVHLSGSTDHTYFNGGGNVGIGTTDPGNFKLKIYNSTGTNTTGSNSWHNHFCVEEQTTAGAGITFKAGTNTGYIYYGSSNGSSWVGSGSFGFATTATGAQSDIKMVIRNDGNVGIGTTSPGISLDVHGTYLGRYYNFGSCHDADKRNSFYIGRWDGNTTQSGVFLGMQLKVDTHDNMGYGSYDNQASIIFQTWGNNYSTSREIMEITANGYVRGINAYQNDSDDRIKHNEKNINAGLNVINKLQAKEYFKTSTLFDENGNIYDSNHNFNLNIDGLPIDASGEVLTDVNKEIGFIAQEVFEIDELKHAVREGNLVSDASGNMYKNKFGLSYEEIFVMNVVATQELDRKVIALESENAELKTKVATLESELAAIKQHLGI